MHTFDSLARSAARTTPRTSPARGPARVRSRESGAMLSAIVSLGCALLPLGVMVHAYLLTA